MGPLRDALEAGGFEVTYLPNHVAATDFPDTAAALAEYAVVILSDIGANTLLLHPETFARSVPRPDRTAAVRDYVRGGRRPRDGGGLPDLRRHRGQGSLERHTRGGRTAGNHRQGRRSGRAPGRRRPLVRQLDHPVVAGLPPKWPNLLGYNRVRPKAGADVVVAVGDDPLIVTGAFGAGRGAAFTSDCGPHWCPPPFVDWVGYGPMWQQLVAWAAG